VYKLVSYKCRKDLEDAADKKPADYIVDIEDEDLQQDVLQILAGARKKDKEFRRCSKKTLLAVLLGL
jgi:hypothetical protein